MQIIVVTAKMQISLRVLSVELQASFLYYVRGGCRHSAPLSSVQIENLWICGQSPPFTQTIFGSWGIYKVNLVTQAVHVRMAKTNICLRIRYIPRFTFLWLILFTWNVHLRKVWPKQTLVSLRVIAVNMVHLYSKSLASLERCMCGKEVIRTACASLIYRCWELSRSSAGLLN